MTPIHSSIYPYIHPSVRQKKNRRGRLVPRCGILGESSERLEYCSWEVYLKSPLAHTNTGPTVQIRVIPSLLSLIAQWQRTSFRSLRYRVRIPRSALLWVVLHFECGGMDHSKHV